MSLIKCPECGREVSSKAEHCPDCGVAILGNVKRCPVCKRFLLMNAVECPQCHTHFIVEQDTKGSSEDEETAAPTPPDGEKHETPHAAERAAKKTKSFAILWLLLITTIILTAIGAYVYWNMNADEEEADCAYQQLINCSDPQSFDDFIARYPKSRYVDDVRQRRKELEHEELAWREVMRSNEVAKLRTFIQEHPASPRIHAVERRIDSLEWREVAGEGTSAAYNRYIERHDNGEFITEAYLARDEALRREAVARKDSVEAAAADSMAVSAPSAN